MKKILLLIILAIAGSIQVKACDICGCGVGNSYIGILPDFNKHIFGFRFRYNSLLTHVGVGGSTSYLTTTEKYRTVELWGGWNIGRKFRVMASVPYSFDERLNQGLTKTKNGMGDLFVSGFYELINSRKTISGKLLVQSLWVGGGIKAPSGKYNPVDKSNTSESANLFQLGTGSTDFTINAMYDIRLQDAGINASASYKMNTTNKYKYTYGNKLSLNGQAYYKFRIKDRVTIAPNAGAMFEKGETDIDNKFAVDISGGNLWMGTLGLEVAFKKVSFGANFQNPLSQDLANGIIKANNRAMVHVSFLL
ncbi:MAG: transporter [Bacteroidota bacterium]